MFTELLYFIHTAINVYYIKYFSRTLWHVYCIPTKSRKSNLANGILHAWNVKNGSGVRMNGSVFGLKQWTSDYLQVAVADPLITFQRWSACKVAGPEIMSVICIGEEIICLQSPELKREWSCTLNTWESSLFCHYEYNSDIVTTTVQFILPGEVCSVQLLEVTRGGGIEQVDFAAIRLLGVDVVDQLVQVLVPQIGILILEVWAHGHDNVIGLIHCSLREKKDEEN